MPLGGSPHNKLRLKQADPLNTGEMRECNLDKKFEIFCKRWPFFIIITLGINKAVSSATAYSSFDIKSTMQDILYKLARQSCLQSRERLEVM